MRKINAAHYDYDEMDAKHIKDLQDQAHSVTLSEGSCGCQKQTWLDSGGRPLLQEHKQCEKHGGPRN